MANSSKSIIFASDMHVMSHHAICPHKPKSGHVPSSLQEKLADGWDWALDKRVDKKTHLLFLNGEPIDGSNWKNRGTSTYTTDWLTGLKDSAQLLRMYKAKYFMQNSGSGYHVDQNGVSAEEILSQMIKTKPYRAYSQFDGKSGEYKDGRKVDQFAWLTINDLLFSITHHIGFNRWFAYKTTALAREMAELTLAQDKWIPKEHQDKDLIVVRSHVHYFVGVRYPTSYGFTTPAWKYPDGFLLRSGLGGTMPHIGTVEVIVEGDGTYSVHPHIIPTKMYPKANVVEV